ncbi:MAG TPA: hypothetical protein VGC47_00200 [Acidimicrobiia bacterium]
MKPRLKFVLIAAAALAAAVYARRPVRPPETKGTWHPADQERAPR